MNVTLDAVELLHHFESCVLEAYPDPGTGAEPWTVGWGCTGQDICEGVVITQDEADALFAKRLAEEFEPGVLRALKRIPLSYQFDAMVCLAYNIGLGAFAGSTLVLMFNARAKPQLVADQFLRWNKAGRRVMLGLSRRRAAERALFLGASAQAAIRVGEAVQK